MPEYLAPGVFVEEVSYRSKSIEGVSTTTTGFIGPTRYGPIGVEPEVVTSLAEFERSYGDGQPLVFASDDADHRPQPPMHNYVWHAVRAFFEEGGKRCYVSRTFDLGTNALRPSEADAAGRWRITTCTARVDVPATGTPRLLLRARWPGDAGSGNVRITLALGPSVTRAGATTPIVEGALRRLDVVRVQPAGAESTAAFWASVESQNTPSGEIDWSFRRSDGTVTRLATLPTTTRVRVVTATVTVYGSSPGVAPHIRGGLALDPNHRQGGAPDSIAAAFPVDPLVNPPEGRSPVTIGLAVASGSTEPAGLAVLTALTTASSALGPALLAAEERSEQQRSVDTLLTGGTDGVRPTLAAYAGTNREYLAIGERYAHLLGFGALASIEDISIVAAPGHTYGYASSAWNATSDAIMRALIRHAERMRYCIAVLDPGERMSVGQVSALRGGIDSKHAALYYPWVRVLDPITRVPIDLPPSGFVAGIYARNDVERGVHKAPANEVVTGAIDFETLLTTGHQEVLNPLGVNCFRFFEGRGLRLWGARTVSSDSEWKYVNLRRYFAYLERSIDRGTQWAVFEPNGEQLWANVRRTISDFLFSEFLKGVFLGEKPEAAYFVKCDRSTMSQNDLDNGRLVCQVGVAVLRPAEFVIFRVGQWTADRKT